MRFFLVAACVLMLGAGCAGTLPSANPPAPGSAALDLSGGTLTALPRETLGRADLEVLDVSDNRIEGALPAEIRLLRNLRVLDASGNAMTGVPAEIGQLSELRILDLSDNRLTGLPLELANLKKLERLDVRGNDVSAEDLRRIGAGLTGTVILSDGQDAP